MIASLIATLALGFAVAIAIVALVGWGNLALRAIGFESPARPGTGTAWLGYCLVCGVVEALHLFIAIDWKVTLLVGVVGFCGLIVDGTGAAGVRAQGARIAGLVARHPWQTALLAVLVFVWFLRAMAVPNNYDSGLYHFQSIRWVNEEPIVFGIGNLHWRLALNQSYFGFLALLNLAPYWNKGYAAGGMVLLLLTLATLIETGIGQSVRWRAIFGAGLLVFLGYVAGSSANPSPDNAVALIEVVIFLFLFRALKPGTGQSRDAIQSGVVALLLCVAVVCTKFSSGAFAVGSGAVLAAYLLHTGSFVRVFRLRVLLVGALLVALHAARGFILSGAPFFPAPWLGAWQLEWAVPVAVANMETALIQSWARMPGAGLAEVRALGDAWFIGWVGRQGYGTLVMFFVGSAFALVNLLRLRHSAQSVEQRGQFLLYVPTIAALVFWFLTAPDVRFLGAVLVLYFLLSVYLASRSFDRGSVGKALTQNSRARLLAPFILALACLGSARFVGLGSLSLNGWSQIPVVSTKVMRTDSGAELFVPESGNQCWNAPLPCASLFNPALRRANLKSHSLFAVGPN